MAVYLVFKIQDLAGNHLFPYLFIPNIEALLYWSEILLGVVVPVILILIPRIRSSKLGLFYSALFVVLGFILNRLNISMTAIERYSGTTYFPSWMEISVTLMVVAIGFAAFRLAVKYLPIFSHNGHVQAPQQFDVVSFHEAVH